MPEVDWNAILQGVGLVVGTALTVFFVNRGKVKSDGTPPPDRAPAAHEVKQALYDMQSKIERTGMDEAAAASLKRSIDLLAGALDRNTSACGAMSEHLGRIKTSIDEMAKELEFSSRLGRGR